MKKIVNIFSFLIFLFLTYSNAIFAQPSFNTGEFAITVNDYGRIRLYTPDTSEAGLRQLERMSILVAGAPYQVFDYQNDADSEEETILLNNPLLSDYEIYGAFNNYYSSEAPDVLVKYNVYGWNGGKFIILKSTVVNRETAKINAIVGMDIIPYLDYEYGFDTVSYDMTNEIIRSHRGLTNLGYKLLSHPLASATAFEWFDGYETDTNYYNWLNHGSIDNEYVSETADGPVIITSQAPQELANGDSIEVYYAVSLGADESEMIANMHAAEEKYSVITKVESDVKNIPSQFTLDQNYPNPFNPSTKISFGLPQKSKVVLKIFNVLGQQVAELLNQQLEAGNHVYNFDGSKLTSGVYIYSLQTDAGTISKKMSLLK
ncbi:MAG: T9SS type A sorting domain-containing protein [Ignavibacteriae bacterium]|nr:T9SS type A sorting domain-containing protein [Ignavibacteriota bacterium]